MSTDLSEFNQLTLKDTSHHYSKYKLKTPLLTENQIERRHRLLLEQKHRRDEKFLQVRDLLVVDELSSMDSENSSNNKILKKHFPPRRSRNHIHRVACPIGLMLAEWLLDVPDDLFTSKWYLLSCPRGQRCLVVTYCGQTYVFNKNGHFICKHSSALPGGSKQSQHQALTILCCIYNSKTEVYYILDLLIWNSVQYIHSECQCRFFILKSQYEENKQQLTTVDDINNPYAFQLIDRSLIESKIHAQVLFEQSLTLNEELDGYLFYHSLGYYSPGYSPLICWLKPFMINEMLKMTLVNDLFIKLPENYQTAQQYMSDEQVTRKTLTNDELYHINEGITDDYLKLQPLEDNSKEKKKRYSNKHNTEDTNTMAIDETNK